MEEATKKKKVERLSLDGKKLKCPECQTVMLFLESWDSHLGLARWNKYGCEYCGGLFEVKRGKK